MKNIVEGFIAYPAFPSSIGETISKAVTQIYELEDESVVLMTWQDMKPAGQFIIENVCEQIDRAALFIADVSDLNLNVLFELGYAIGKKKRLWLIRDSTLTERNKKLDDTRLLTTVLYRSYSNADDIAKAFHNDAPHKDLANTLFKSQIEQNLSSDESRGSIFFLKSNVNSEASVATTLLMREYLGRPGVRVTVDDPQETPTQSLTWYGRQVHAARHVVCHFTEVEREGAAVRNAKCALIAGLAVGMGRDVLLLASTDYFAPLDYRDAMITYPNANSARKQLEGWFARVVVPSLTPRPEAVSLADRRRRAAELSALDLGEEVAENEEEDLVDGYFIPTATYRDAAAGRHRIFVGRKGAGKSASFLQLKASLAVNRRNLVCVVQPVAYELHALQDLFARFASIGSADRKAYLIDALWRFLLYSEIARHVHARLRERDHGALTRDEVDFMRYVDERPELLTEDIAVRSEAAIARISLALSSFRGEPTQVEAYQQSIRVAVFRDVVGGLKDALEAVLDRYDRVSFVVDNLDKTWERNADFSLLAEFLLALLNAATKIGTDLPKDRKGNTVPVSLAVFLRADIFDQVTRIAREPDKLQFARLEWNDQELLSRLVNERYMRSFGEKVPEHGESVWQRFFVESVQGVPVCEYLFRSVIPRPRDFLVLAKSAVQTAVNRGHSRVEEADVLDARKRYSEFAYESIRTETIATLPWIEDLLLRFLQAPAVLSTEELDARIAGGGNFVPAATSVRDALMAVAFIGVEHGQDEVRYADSYDRVDVTVRRAQAAADAAGKPLMYVIHPAFRPFFDVADP